MRCEARLRGRATLLVRAEALPEARGSPCGAMAFSLLRAMGSMIEPRASWVRSARAYRGVRQGRSAAAPLRTRPPPRMHRRDGRPAGCGRRRALHYHARRRAAFFCD